LVSLYQILTISWNVHIQMMVWGKVQFLFGLYWLQLFSLFVANWAAF